MAGLPLEYAIRNLGRSPSRLLLTAIGSGLVVALVIGAGAFVNGMQNALRTSGSDQNVVIMGIGSEESIERSEIAMSTPTIAATSIPGLVQMAGRTAVSPEIHSAIEVRTEEGASINAMIRGVYPEAFLVHREVSMLAGFPPRTSANQIAVGRLATRALGYDTHEEALGKRIVVDDVAFEITGVLAADGGVIEGEIWMPLTDLQIVTQRDSLSCVVVRLRGRDLGDVEAFTATRIDLELIATRESEYYESLSAFFRPIRLMVIATAIMVAVGGVIGGLNTTYAAFASRVREIGTLQTLGYSRLAVVRSLLVESVLAAAIGGLVAAGMGMWLLDGVAIRFSMGVFGLAVTPGVVATGLGFGLALGLVGAVMPAIRCLRLSIPEALKAN